MTRKKNKSYLLLGGALIGSLTLISGIFSYTYFEMQYAYQKQDYKLLEYYGKSLQHFSTAAQNLLLKSALEQTIIKNTPSSKTGNLIIDPISYQWGQNSRLVSIGSTSRDTHDSDWILLFKRYYQECNKMYNPESDFLYIRPYIYTELINASEPLDFRGKDIYQTSCSLYYFVDITNQLTSTIKMYCFPFSEQFDNDNLQESTQIYFSSINKYNMAITKTEYMQQTQLFFDEYEKQICTSITEQLQFAEKSLHQERKPHCYAVAKQLYTYLEFTEKGRNKYPRPQYITNLLDTIEKQLSNITKE